jgi:hypothetical protein
VEDIKPVIRQVGAQLIMSFKLLLPVIQQLFQALPQLISALMPMIPAMVQIADTVFKLAGSLLPLFVSILQILLPIIEGLASFIGKNVEVMTALIVAITTAVVAVKTWNTAIIMGQLAMKLFNTVIIANPLGALITALLAVVAGLVYFFTQTEIGREAWAVFSEFVTTTTQAIAEWFGYVFGEWLPGLWDGFVTFLSDGWQGFKDGFFRTLEAIGDFFKSMINGYISMWEGFVNFFVGGINSIIRGINRLSISIPAIGDAPGMTVGFNLPTIPRVSLPRLAEGGIVKAQPGGIIANIGEGQYDEAVIPLKPGMSMGSTYNITVNAGMGADGSRIGEQIIREIKRYERQSGPVFARA